MTDDLSTTQGGAIWLRKISYIKSIGQKMLPKQCLNNCKAII